MIVNPTANNSAQVPGAAESTTQRRSVQEIRQRMKQVGEKHGSFHEKKHIIIGLPHNEMVDHKHCSP